MLSKKEVLILERTKGSEENSKTLEIKLEDAEFFSLKKEADSRNLSVEDLFLIFITEKMFQVRKEKLEKENPDMVILDIFDMYRAEEIIEELTKENKSAIIMDYNEKDVVLMPINQYNKLINSIK